MTDEFCSMKEALDRKLRLLKTKTTIKTERDAQAFAEATHKLLAEIVEDITTLEQWVKDLYELRR